MLDIHDLSILVVDDMQSMRRSIIGMLKGLEIKGRLKVAENGRVAWRILKSAPVDLAIIDWNMPVMNGIELLNLIRGDKELRDMPTIMITAEAEKRMVVEAAESEIDFYLLKPLTMRSLDERIRSVVGEVNTPPPVLLHLRKAREHEEKEDIPSAIIEAKLALKERPNASRILRKLGIYYLQAGRADIAEKCILKAVAVNKYDSVSLTLLGDIYKQSSKWDNAVKCYDQAMGISSRNLRNGLEMGRELLEMGMIEKARFILEKVIASSKNDAEFREDVADICIENQYFFYAQSLLEGLREEYPDREDIALKTGALFEKTGDMDGLVALYQTLPDNVDAQLRLAEIFMDRKRVVMADGYINRVLKLYPENEKALELRRQNV